jgi:hypothetical protein
MLPKYSEYEYFDLQDSSQQKSKLNIQSMNIVLLCFWTT